MMSVKSFVRWLICFATLLLTAAPAAAAEGRSRPARPNVIILLADDLRWDALGFAGNGLVKTPHLDALAKRGTRFRNAFVTTSICSVSRASILTGQYARRHKINDFTTDLSAEAFAQTYVAILRAAGYRVGFIGKYGVGTKMPEAAFDYWRGFPGQGNYFKKGDPAHLTRRMGDQAVEFLEGCDGKTPFCLSLSFKCPHAQDGAKREFPPDPHDEKLYEGVTFPVPKTADEKFFLALPEFVQKSEGRKRWQRRYATPEQFQKTVRDYHRLVAGMDREVGRIVAALERHGLLENTIIVFTSDNGFFFGERGMADKWLMYEESIRVPLVVVDPRLPPGKRGRTADGMALNIDLAPTVLDYAGLAAPKGMQGRSLRPLVEGRAAAWRADWFYEHHTLPKILPPSEGVRAERWAYLRWLPTAEAAVEELYDVRADPLQEHNLAGAARHRDTLARLRARWERLRRELE